MKLLCRTLIILLIVCAWAVRGRAATRGEAFAAMTVEEAKEMIASAPSEESCNDFVAAALRSGRLDLVDLCLDDWHVSARIYKDIWALPDSTFKDEIQILLLKNYHQFWPPEEGDLADGSRGLGGVDEKACEPFKSMVQKLRPDLHWSVDLFEKRAARLQLAAQLTEALQKQPKEPSTDKSKQVTPEPPPTPASLAGKVDNPFSHPWLFWISGIIAAAALASFIVGFRRRSRKTIITTAVLLLGSVWVLVCVLQSQSTGTAAALAHGDRMEYVGVTTGTTNKPGGRYRGSYKHTLVDPRAWYWDYVQELPDPIASRFHPPRDVYVGYPDSDDSQIMWFKISGPFTKASREYQVSLKDSAGFESVSGYFDVKGIAGPGYVGFSAPAPRRDETLTFLIRASSQCKVVRDTPLATLSISNPIKPAGAPMVEKDPLPIIKHYGKYTLTIKKVIRHQRQNKRGADTEIDWEITKDGVACPEWQVGYCHFSDGGGNTWLAGASPNRQHAEFISGLFSDDPVWRIHLEFRRTDRNQTDYDPIIEIKDLPIPQHGETIDLNQKIAAPPFTVDLEETGHDYFPPYGDVMWLHGKVTPVEEHGKIHLLPVDNSVYAEHTPGSLNFMFPKPKDAKIWTLKFGVDNPLKIDFQTQVKFVP